MIKLNIVLPSGLYVINAKPLKDKSLFMITASDFARDSRFILDAQHKRVILSKDDIVLTEADISAIVEAIAKAK